MDRATKSACVVAATKYKVPLSTIMAVVQVESNGVTFAKVHGRNEPLIRWEGHYFDKRLIGADQAKARAQGLSSPKAGRIANPSKQQDRWDKLFSPASAINAEAAAESISIGVGQVMGAHDVKLGFKTAVSMLDYARKGAIEQVDVMMRYCDKFGLIDELQRADFAGFARGYNGPNYKKYKYDTQIRKYAKQFSQQDDASTVDGVSVAKPERSKKAEGMLRMGTSGPEVRELQELLNRASVKYGGGAVKVDGDFGPTTKQAVIQFQKAAGFTGKDIDGIAGPMTLKKLEQFKVDPDEDLASVGPVETITKTTEGRQGAAGALAGTSITAGVEQAKDALFPVTGTGGVVDTIYTVLVVAGVVLTVAGVAWIAWGWWKANTNEGVKE